MINHIFFDLDGTLWDFEKNSYITLVQLVSDFRLLDKGVDAPDKFIEKYKLHNDKLWALYRENKIEKEKLLWKRFALTLEEYRINDIALAEKIGLAYITESPLKTELFPYSIALLEYLQKKYKLHIITNGFDQVQHVKLAVAKLTEYFDVIITSEQVGVRKPDAKIFAYALAKAGAKPEESIMIGNDLEVDVLGAEKAGIQGVYFNVAKLKHNESVVHEIYCLSELMALL